MSTLDPGEDRGSLVTPREVSELLGLRETNVLTVYLDVDPTKPENQRAIPAFGIWLKNALQALSADLPDEQSSGFDRAVSRVSDCVKYYLRAGKGLIVFAGEDLWKAFDLPLPVTNEVHWGRPHLPQLLWLLDEYEGYGVVLADSETARFFTVYLGTIFERKEMVLSLDTSDWKEKDQVAPSFPEYERIGGSHRNAFEDRLDEQIQRFLREVAQSTEGFVSKEDLEQLFLAGTDAVHELERLLSPQLRENIVSIVPMDTSADEHDVLEKTWPLQRAAVEKENLQLVRRVVEQAVGREEVVTGVQPTLTSLQQGRLQLLIASREISAEVRKCLKCGFCSSESFSKCPVCNSSDVHNASLTTLLPYLCRKYSTKMKILSAGLAGQLNPQGGIGGIHRF